MLNSLLGKLKDIFSVPPVEFEKTIPDRTGRLNDAPRPNDCKVYVVRGGIWIRISGESNLLGSADFARGISTALREAAEYLDRKTVAKGAQ